MKAKFTTLCSKERLQEIRNFVKEQIKPLALPELEKERIILAIDEACANAIIHGNACDESRKLEIEMEVTGEKLEVRIHDVGLRDAEEIASLPGKDIKEIVRKKQKGGMGLRLIRSVMDEVDYYREDDKFICRLTKKLG